MTCVFCKILADQLPASRVHEDDNCLALMDIHPLGRGHVLVIPKRHAVQLTELRPEESRHLFTIGNRILHAQRSLGWGVQGSQILLNDGPAPQAQPLPYQPTITRDTLGDLIHQAVMCGKRLAVVVYRTRQKLNSSIGDADILQTTVVYDTFQQTSRQ